MKCPVCLSENSPDSRYCHKCGSAMDTAFQTLTYTPSQEAELTRGLKFNPGDKFGDRYTIIEEIGRGGMGVVYKAEDHELGITVVLKMIRPELASQPGMIDHFRKETLLGRSITHENVVRIHDLGEVNGIRYISMDFVKGENLCEFIQTSGTLALSTCLRIAVQICRAVKAAHLKQVIHQDLKPQNVMIDSSGRVYVTDFGLARSVAAAGAHRPGARTGTPKYFSPEQARGEEADERSDIYSLGVIMYEMMTGAAPFAADTPEGYSLKHASEKPSPPSRINPEIPPGCEKIILRCLEKDRDLRYQSVDELLRDLEAQEKFAVGPGAKARSMKLRKSLTAAAVTVVLGVALFELYRVLAPVHPPPRPPGRTSIAVLYAVNNSGDKSLTDQLRWVIPYYLGADLAQSKYLSVLPQDSLMQILSDMRQLDEDHHLSKTLDRISEKTAVDYFVLPSFTKVGDDFWISFTVRQAKSDAAIGEPDTVKGSRLEDVLSMVDDLSQKVKSRLSFSQAEIAGDANQSLAKITTGSLAAARYYIEAEKYYIQADFRASIQALEKAVKEDPYYALAYLKMAIDYQYLGEYANHRKYLQKALALADRVSERERYIIRGTAAYALNESPLPAIEIYKEFIERYPDDESGQAKLGAIYRNLEEWDKAWTQFEKVLAINPRNTLAVENSIVILTSTGRYQEALKLCEAGAKGPLNERFMLWQIALINLIQGQYERADAELKKALRLMPDDPRFIELKGAVQLLKGDLASAQGIFASLRLKGESTPAAPELRGRFWLIYLHLLRGEYSRAQKEISEGIAIAQGSGLVYDELELHLLLARSELELKRFSRSAEALKTALEIAQKTVSTGEQILSLHLLGLASLGMGQIDAAKKTGQELQQLIDRTAFTRQTRHQEDLMGHIADAEGHPGQAAGYFERAILSLPSQSNVRDEHAFYFGSLAAAEFESGDLPKAIETYQRIISLTTGRLRWGGIFARSYYWLGKAYQKTGDNPKARDSFQSFLKLWKDADSGLPEVADARAQLETLDKLP